MKDIFEHINLPDTMTQEKLDFLKEAVKGGANLNNNQLIPYFTGLIRKANQQNISFTDEEVKLLIVAIRESSSGADQSRIDQLLKLTPKKMQ